MFAAHAQHGEQSAHGRVALQTSGKKPRQFHTGIRIGRKCHHLIPIAGRTPVAFHIIRHGRVSALLHIDAIRCRPTGLGAEGAHDVQRHLYIGTAHNPAFQLQPQTFLHHGTNHQQSTYILAAHATRERHAAATVSATRNAQGREALLLHVLHLCAKLSKRIHKHTNRAVLHALRSRDDMHTFVHTQESRKETHGRSGSHNVNGLWHLSQRIPHHTRIVAIRNVPYPTRLSVSHAMRHITQGIHYQCAVAYALAGRQNHTTGQFFGRFYAKFHPYFTFLNTKLRKNLVNTKKWHTFALAKQERDVAQLVAHASGGREVASSSLVIPTYLKH